MWLSTKRAPGRARTPLLLHSAETATARANVVSNDSASGFLICRSSAQLALQPRSQVIADAERVRHDGQRRVHGAGGREEARVHDVQVVEVVRLAVPVERR